MTPNKYLAILLASLVLFGIASAQEYAIRANRGLNLRAAPGLNASIADTVASGAILQVVGASGNWLKINRNGNEVWLADWVNYSRVDSSEQAGSEQQTSQIDNCCFVDRQCQSDQEWINGYWAFQNQECPTPAQQPAQPSSQPVSAASSQADNCCFVDRQCRTDAEWEAGYWAFQNSHCPSSAQAPLGQPSRPRIEGSEVFARQINATLDLMRKTAPEWYDYVISAMDRVVEVPSQPGNPSSCIGGVNPAILGRTVTAHSGCAFIASTCWSQRMWWVGLLAHEACHIHTYEAGIDYAAMGLDEETECGKIGHAATSAVNPAWARSVVKRNLNATRVSLGQSIIVPTC